MTSMTAGWQLAATSDLTNAAGLVAVALLLWLVASELARPRRRFRWARLVASVAIVLALFLLVTEPAHRRPVDARRVVLVTPGASAELLEAAKRQPDELLRVVGTAPPSFALGPEFGHRPDAAALARELPTAERWRVVGYGLPSWEWDALSGAVTLAAPARPEAGIQQVDWSREIVLGGLLVIRGRVGGSALSGTLKLFGPGGVEDVHEVDADEDSTFALQARPRQTGRLTYRLGFYDSEDRLVFEESLDVRVTPVRDVRLLWLEEAPSFETRHVKHWLTERGAALVIRSTLSRDRYREEFHHHQRIALESVTRELASRFDLVVLDPRAFAALDEGEREGLRDAVSEDGIGVLVLPGGGGPSTQGLTTIPVVAVDGLEKLTVRPSWPGSSGSTRLTIEARQIGRRTGLRPLVRDDSGRVLAAAAPIGRGTVGLSLLSETYRWVLEGHAGEHASYWSYLVSALARPLRDADVWRLPGAPILVDRPQELTLDTERPEPRVRWVSPDGVDEPLAVIEDSAAPGRWRVTVRPTRPGWYTLTVDGETSASFRASADHTWRAWQQTERLRATRNRASVETPTPAGDTETAPLVRPLPRGFAYLLLIVSAAFLWASDRWGR